MDTNFYQQVWEQNTLKVVVGMVNGRGYKSTKKTQFATLVRLCHLILSILKPDLCQIQQICYTYTQSGA